MTGFKAGIWIRCWPNNLSLYSLKVPKVLTSHTGYGFLVSKTWFLKNTPISTGVKPGILIKNLSLKSLHSSKIQTFLQATVGHVFVFVFFLRQKHGTYETPQDF